MRVMYNTILLPIDGSEGSAEAVDSAIDLAKKYDSTVYGLVVVDQSSYAGISSDVKRDQIREEQVEDAQKITDELSENLSEVDVDHETEVIVGIPNEQIAEYTNDNDIDLIVMGTHGRSGVNRFLLGSTTEKVLRRASIPVHCVPVMDES